MMERNRIINILINETGIPYLHEFEEIEHMTFQENLLNFLFMRYHYDNVQDYRDFLLNRIEFSPDVLERYQIDESFFEHLTIKEVIEIIIKKILGGLGLSDDNLPVDKNYYPKDLNFERNLNDFIKYNQENVYAFGYIPNHIWDERYILNNLKRKFSIDEWNNSKFFYHGTTWESAFSILDSIDLSNRYTDFGKYTFYVSDSFKSATKWAVERNQQGAVIIFKPMTGWIDDINPSKIKVFSHRLGNINEWKKFVYRCRHKQKPFEFMNYDYISGPILANPKSLLDEYTYLQYGYEIPYQIAVRTNQLTERLRLSIAGIIFFPQDTLRKDVFGI